MTPNEQKYYGTTLRIAFSLLIFLGVSFAQSALLVFLPVLTGDWDPVTADVVEQIVSGLLYALTFTLPALLFKVWPSATPARPLNLSLKMPRQTPLYIFFGMAVTMSAAYINAQIVSVFRYSEFSQEVLWGTEITSNYQLVLLFFTLAVVPAFVEELLFRAVILENLLPYGRTTAIVGSAFLFGLMHQNAEQFFYATAAGVVLGWIYTATHSVWPCVLMHLVNNFQSVLQTAVVERLPAATADAVLYVMEGGLLLIGVICGVLLFLRERDRRADLRAKGAFEQTLQADPDHAECALPLRRRVRLFFNAPMIVFAGFCVFSMLLLILMAVALY